MSAFSRPLGQGGKANVSVSVIRSVGGACSSDLRSWADSYIDFSAGNTYYELEGRKQTTVSGLIAYEAVFDSYGSSKEVNLYLMAGQNSYRLIGRTDIVGNESPALAVQFLESVLYSFDPGPAAAPAPPPQPPNSRLQHSNSETIYLSDGSILFQGYFTNNDSYWWATDITVKLQLRNASSFVVADFEVTPYNEQLQPGERTLYEIRVPPNQSAWDTSLINWAWNWSCS